MSSLGVILARGASKRLPRKNVRPLAGTPLVAWTCRAAAASRIGRVILSTEDPEIAAIGRAAGVEVPFVRPAALAEDFALDVDIVLHAVDAAAAHYGETYDTVVMIQATTPFVQPAHFDACLDRLHAGGFACVFTARKAEDHPRWTWVADDSGRARSYVDGRLTPDEQHGQNLPAAYYPTGGAWAVSISALRQQNAIYCEPLGLVEVPWQYAVDIDDVRDWMIAETVAREYGFAPVGAGAAPGGAGIGHGKSAQTRSVPPAGRKASRQEIYAKSNTIYDEAFTSGSNRFARVLGHNPNRQFYRFHEICHFLGDVTSRRLSILEVGCGNGEFFRFLNSCGFSGRYVGVDINESLLQEAARLLPDETLDGVSFLNKDILAEDLGPFDHVIMSGVFNINMGQDDDFVFEMIQRMAAHALHKVVFNAVTDYVSFRDPKMYYINPETLAHFIIKRVSPRFEIRHHFLPYNYTVCIHKDNDWRSASPPDDA